MPERRQKINARKETQSKNLGVTNEKTSKSLMIIQERVPKRRKKYTPERRLIEQISVTKEKTGKPWMIIQEWVPK